MLLLVSSKYDKNTKQVQFTDLMLSVGFLEFPMEKTERMFRSFLKNPFHYS
jgi:hypothetical protein